MGSIELGERLSMNVVIIPLGVILLKVLVKESTIIVRSWRLSCCSSGPGLFGAGGIDIIRSKGGQESANARKRTHCRCDAARDRHLQRQQAQPRCYSDNISVDIRWTNSGWQELTLVCLFWSLVLVFVVNLTAVFRNGHSLI